MGFKTYGRAALMAADAIARLPQTARVDGSDLGLPDEDRCPTTAWFVRRLHALTDTAATAGWWAALPMRDDRLARARSAVLVVSMAALVETHAPADAERVTATLCLLAHLPGSVEGRGIVVGRGVLLLRLCRFGGCLRGGGGFRRCGGCAGLGAGCWRRCFGRGGLLRCLLRGHRAKVGRVRFLGTRLALAKLGAAVHVNNLRFNVDLRALVVLHGVLQLD